jgi:hypothetical protein
MDNYPHDYLRDILKAGVSTGAWPGVSRKYSIHQSPPELAAFCQFIEEQGVRSYLEIGLGRGGTWTLLSETFGFATTAGITMEYRQPWHQPANGVVHIGGSQTPEALAFAVKHGPYDLIFVDGSHLHDDVMQDYRNLLPLGRFLAFHDIAGLYDSAGSRTSWEAIKAEATVVGEIIDPDWPIGIGIIRGQA